ncbi:MAG: IclR family transcriptional regulator [Moorellaceae bacterium]
MMGYENLIENDKDQLRREEDYTINSLVKGMQVLFSFIDQNVNELTLTEICYILGCSKATAKRLLFTLEKCGLIERLNGGRKYVLGIRTFELGCRAMQSIPLIRCAREQMEWLARTVNETVILVQRQGEQQLYLDKVEGVGTAAVRTKVGMRRPLYYGQGKVILAYLPEESWYRILPEEMPRYTVYTITRRDDFIEELRRIREQGYGIEREEYIEGAVGIGVPLFNRKEVVGLMGCVIPSHRSGREQEERIVGLLRKVAEVVKEKLEGARA